MELLQHFEQLKMSGLNNENKENKVTEMVNKLLLESKMSSKYFFQIFIMVSVYLFCWGPYALQSLLSIFGLAEVQSSRNCWSDVNLF